MKLTFVTCFFENALHLTEFLLKRTFYLADFVGTESSFVEIFIYTNCLKLRRQKQPIEIFRHEF